jgi:hypothetical protein
MEIDEDMEIWTRTWRHGREHGAIETWGHGIKILRNFEVSREKSKGTQKPRQFFLIRLKLDHCANGSSSLVRLLTKKQTKVILLQDLPICD